MVAPGQFPVYFPDAIDESEIPKVGGDINFGLEGVYYVNANSRIGAAGGIGFGAAFTSADFVVKYDFIADSDALDILLGAGVGLGTMTFRGDDGTSRVRVPYYPLRAEAAAMIPDQTRAYQGTMYLQYDLPSAHYYTNGYGDEVEAHTGLYLTLGVEICVMFGDFEPPRPPSRPPPGPPPAGPPGGPRR
jgi:hypothetical protein